MIRTDKWVVLLGQSKVQRVAEIGGRWPFASGRGEEVYGVGREFVGEVQAVSLS